jgi:hypothetical protein
LYTAPFRSRLVNACAPLLKPPSRPMVVLQYAHHIGDPYSFAAPATNATLPNSSAIGSKIY